MPGGMTGADLAEAVRARRPEIKVLFTSGYAEPDVVRRGQKGRGRLAEEALQHPRSRKNPSIRP